MLTVQNLGHRVAGRWLFRGLNFSLEQERSALVGPNGVGKSTLAKILAAESKPSEGRVIARTQVGYFPQSQVPRSGETIAQALATLWETPGAQLDLANRLVGDLDFSKALTSLSGGEWMRVRLARALMAPQAYLIFDEPSNNLDVNGKSILRGFLEGFKGGFLLISHDRGLLQCADSVFELSNQGLSRYGGDFEFYWSERERERNRELEAHRDRKRERQKREMESREKVEAQEKRQRRGAREASRGGLPKILIGGRKRRAQVTMAKIEVRERESVEASSALVEQSWDLLKQDPFVRLDFHGAGVPAGQVLLQTQDLNWIFPGETGRLWSPSLTWTVRGPQRWHLMGANGSGKSTLMKILLGDRQLLGQLEGSFTIRENLAVAALDQGYGSLDPAETLLQNLRRNTRFSEAELRNELAFYGFTGDQVFQLAETFSGGERLRACLAQMFLASRIPELIVLDEPTNNLDLMSLALLERALMNFEGALIVISHDEVFVQNLGITDELTLSSIC